jgi:hypothetical protein
MAFFERLFGKGQGRGAGQGQGQGQGRGLNRQPEGFGAGPEGECVCSSCGAKAPHQTGVPCYEQKCPKCGQVMTRA